MQLFNFEGEAVMRKEMPIWRTKLRLDGPDREFEQSVPWVASAITNAMNAPGWKDTIKMKGKGMAASYEHTMHGEVGITPDPSAHNCIPRWGIESDTQRYIFLFSVAILLFALIAIPLMLILWLVFASVYYISIEQEFRRRENIEALHSQLKKKEV